MNLSAWKRVARLTGPVFVTASAPGRRPSSTAWSEAAAEFRYARDLITAEETEAWLAGRGLTAEDWSVP